MKDAIGRDWICFPVRPHVVQELNMLSDLVDLVKADEKAGEKTAMRLVFCREVGELPGKLADDLLKDEEE